MCGITGLLLASAANKKIITEDFRKSSKLISHRGPDRSICIEYRNPVNVVLSFERLSIMDPSTRGDQPFKFEYDNRVVYVMCNGEIYNYHELCKKYDLEPTSGSDCEVIPLLYKKFGPNKILDICQEFDSEHAFMILDIDMKSGDYQMILSSDRYGLRPLFVGWTLDCFCFSSELQGLCCLSYPLAHIERFKPRTYAILEKKNGVLGQLQYHPYYCIKPQKILHYDLPVCLAGVKFALEEAVISRLESDRPYGSLLSGGLDSSLVSAIAANYLRSKGIQLRTFSIGMEGGTDEAYAKMVAAHIDSIHTHITVSEADFVAAIPNIVETIGSFDITSVRASTGQYLISKWISENTDIKVLLVGDGSDEVTGGYKYFLNTIDPAAFDAECIRLVEDIHQFDGLRADRCISRWGIEARFPFLSADFVDFYLSCDPVLRMPQSNVEKWLLREAFKGSNLLPEVVRCRPKEAFSDGVSSVKKSWYEIIIENTNKMYTDDEAMVIARYYSHLRPVSKESLYYRNLFVRFFGQNESVAKTIPYFWLPKWSGNIVEPSARVLKVYA